MAKFILGFELLAHGGDKRVQVIDFSFLMGEHLADVAKVLSQRCGIVGLVIGMVHSGSSGLLPSLEIEYVNNSRFSTSL